MAIGKGNGRHWIKAAIGKPAVPAPVEGEVTPAAKLAKLAHSKAKTARVAATIKKAGKK